MGTVAGIDDLNVVDSRSQVVQFNDCSSVDNSSVILLISNLNCHVTGSVVTNDDHNIAVTLVNYNNVRS